MAHEVDKLIRDAVFGDERTKAAARKEIHMRAREYLDRVREFIDPIPNLHTVGRNGMHKYKNQDHSMLTAMMAIWNMQGAAHDIWAVNTDFEYHEEQKLEAPAPRIAAAG